MNRLLVTAALFGWRPAQIGSTAAFEDRTSIGSTIAVQQAQIEVDTEAVVVVGVVLVVLGLVQGALAIGLTRGRELFRSAFAVIATLQIAPAVYALVALQDVRAGSVLPLAISLGVLWLLFGAPRSQEFFAS